MGVDDGPLEVVRSYLASFSTGDPDAVSAHVAEDFENVHTSSLGEPCTGRAAYRSRLPDFLAKFRNLSYEVVETFEEDDRIAVAYTMRAVHEGSAIEIHGMFRFLVSEGLIQLRVDYFDSLSFLQQSSPERVARMDVAEHG